MTFIFQICPARAHEWNETGGVSLVQQGADMEGVERARKKRDTGAVRRLKEWAVAFDEDFAHTCSPVERC